MKFLKMVLLACFLTLPAFAMCGDCPSSSKKIFIMLGAPGAGKGTQSVRLCDQYQVPQISPGDLFRENLRQNTPTGLKAKSYMEKGQLVPDEIVLEMVFARLAEADCKNGYILDGFPRTIPQAEGLDQHLNASEAQIVAISLEVPDEVILERLTGRLVCEKCGAPYHKVYTQPKEPGICDRDGGKLIQRKDDTEEVIKDRLAVFHQQTAPVKEYYQKKGCLVLIDGTVSKESTISQIDTALNKVLH